MKKSLCLWVVFVFCILGVANAIGEKETIEFPNCHKKYDEAIGVKHTELRIGQLYHDDGFAGYFKLETDEKGKYTFYLDTIQDSWDEIKIYDKYEQLIVKSGAVYGWDDVYKAEIELEENQSYVVYLDANVKCFFAICGPNQHAGLGSAQVVKKATCTDNGISAQVCELCGGWANETVIPATGHKPGEWTTKTPATCTEEGLMVQPCMVCKEAVASNPIPAKGHLPGEWTVTLEATCSQNGIRSIHCRQCSSILENETLPLGDHKPGRMHTVAEATCMLEGRKEQRCEICNLLMAQETEAAHGHRNAKWVTLRDATCTAEGTRALRCDDCGETLNTETIVPFGHSYSEWVHRDPVCTIEGRNMQHCTVCGVELHYEVLPALGHQYTEWEVVRPATTELEGRESCHCVRCGDTQLQSIGKLNFIEGLFSK